MFNAPKLTNAGKALYYDNYGRDADRFYHDPAGKRQYFGAYRTHDRSGDPCCHNQRGG